MERTLINYQVNHAISDWQKERFNLNFTFSESSKELIVQLIENIKKDISPQWKTYIDYDSLQLKAIRLLPKAFDEIGIVRRVRIHSQIEVVKTRKIITTWEIVHSMPRILEVMNFIDKDV